MANPEQVALLKRGVEKWNQWRKDNPDIEIDLMGANLSKAHLDKVHRNNVEELQRPTFTFAWNEKVYSPWDVADLFMHGAVFHGADREKRTILEAVAPAHLLQLEHSFRIYIVDILETMDNTRRILLKAKELSAISDAPVEPTG